MLQSWEGLVLIWKTVDLAFVSWNSNFIFLRVLSQLFWNFKILCLRLMPLNQGLNVLGLDEKGRDSESLYGGVVLVQPLRTFFCDELFWSGKVMTDSVSSEIRFKKWLDVRSVKRKLCCIGLLIIDVKVNISLLVLITRLLEGKDKIRSVHLTRGDHKASWVILL